MSVLQFGLAQIVLAASVPIILLAGGLTLLLTFRQTANDRAVGAAQAVLGLAPVVLATAFLVSVWGSGQATLGEGMAAVGLGLGALFFAYSTRYYVASVSALLTGAQRLGGHDAGRRQRVLATPVVSIQVATFNEKRVVRRLLDALSRLNYPNYEVVLVDDSTDGSPEEVAEFARLPNFTMLHRKHRSGFKGGALREAMRWMDPRADFVMIVDADFVPLADAIDRFLPYFYEEDGITPRPEIAAVQSYQWHTLNRNESWLTEAVHAEYAGSYMVERPFQQAVGALKMIAGTTYLIRADVLAEIGWGTSITEDWELTLKLYERGYKVAYTPYAEIPAECVATLPRLMRQRMRWAEGHTHQVKRHFWKVMGSSRVSFVEKVEFAYYSLYYLQAALFILGSLAWGVSDFALHAHLPLWTSAFGWGLVLSNLFSLPLMNATGLYLQGATLDDFAGVLGATVTSYLLVPAQAYAALKGLIEKEEGGWFRTPKTGRVTSTLRHLTTGGWLSALTQGKRRLGGGGRSSNRPGRGGSGRIAGWLLIVFGVSVLGLASKAGHPAPAFAATGQAWACGYYAPNGASTPQNTLIENYNGTSWSQMTAVSPSATINQCNGISAVSATDIWAVGYYDDATNSNNPALLTEHYNGTSWSQVTAPMPSVSGKNAVSQANGVDAIASNDVWMVGFSNNRTGNGLTLAELYNGTSWSIVATPNGSGLNSELVAVSGIASNDVWAAGWTSLSGTGAYNTLIEHYNGTSWSVVTSPNPGGFDSRPYAIKEISATDIWVLGYTTTGSGGVGQAPMAIHYNGTSWTTVTMATAGTAGIMYGVDGVATNNVIGVGQQASSGNILTNIQQYTTSWANMTSIDPSATNNVLNGIAMGSASDAWAVGYYATTSDFALAEHYDGTSWSNIAAAQPASSNSFFNSVTMVSSVVPENLLWLLPVALVAPAVIEGRRRRRRGAGISA